MLVRYASLISFVSLLVGFFAVLFVGWAFAEAVPVLGNEYKQEILIYAGAIAVVMLPVWLVHWRWARQKWVADSPVAQRYLLFFSAMGLGATVVIGVQLIIRVLTLLTAENGDWNAERDFLIGGSWSVLLSVLLCWYHCREWMRSRQLESGGGSA